MKNKLSDIIDIKRRYSRSVNLDRDLESAISLSGYILSPKNAGILKRILESLKDPIQPKSWTITGLYGTGKSAFAEFLLGLLSPTGSALNLAALAIIKEYDIFERSVYDSFRRKFGKQGLICAVTVAKRESLKKTIIRALYRGSKNYWKNKRGSKPKAFLELEDICNSDFDYGNFSDETILRIIAEIATASKSGILILIDELGKILEYSSSNGNSKDLFLLQQIAELPSTKNGTIVSLIGILHQSFSDYSQNMNQTDKNEWVKIQGRFEDIAFSETHDHTMQLISNVIDNKGSKAFLKRIRDYSRLWASSLNDLLSIKKVTCNLISNSYPMHPLSLITLPILCERFAQNERSMFSFMTSSEPFSFVRFLENNNIVEPQLQYLKLHNLYDYFIESSGFVAIQDKVFQRWVEIQNYLADFEHMGKEVQSLIKTIGILNLVSHTGELSAQKELVVLSLCNSPNSKKEQSKWIKILDDLIHRKLLNYRVYGNEIRLWEGSDFDINLAVKEYQASINESFESILSDYLPLDPVIAHRHSYETGTLRYFERMYTEDLKSIDRSYFTKSNADGFILYYVGDGQIELIPEFFSITEKPIVIVKMNFRNSLKKACHDLIALNRIEKKSPELKTDGVARKEIRQRIILAKKVVEIAVRDSITPTSKSLKFYHSDKEGELKHNSELSELLSDLCDNIYSKSPKLWNEMINRDQLTAQISKARRELIEAMLKNEGKPDLNIKGFGPEKTIFDSILKSNKIYYFRSDGWKFRQPSKDSGLYEVWCAMEGMCKKAVEKPHALTQIYKVLRRPPYGVRVGVLPIVLLSILLKNANSMCLYIDGSFIPIVGPEHFELLVKKPERFSIKYFHLKGLRLELFKNLSDLFQVKETQGSSGLKNNTLLGIVKPLVKFMKSLPKFTLQTGNLDDQAYKVREALLNAREPDKLLFSELP